MIYHDIIRGILDATWPVLLICSIIAICFKLYDLLINKKKLILYKEILYLAFIIYCICLFQTVTFQDVSWSTSNITPFKEIFRYEFGSNYFFRNVVGNIVMFIPLGFFLSYFLKIKNFLYLIIMCLIISVSIEITQLLIGRVFDVDDLVLNVIGGLLGYGLFYVLNKLKIYINDKICNIIVIIILFIIGIYLGGLYV